MKANNNNQKYSVIILAGGNSLRMGSPKAWLLKGNTTFLSEIIKSYQLFGIETITVVLNEKFTTSEWKNELSEIKSNATLIKNCSPEKGRLYSLQLGLKAVKSDFAFIHNVDNPFVENEVLEELINHTEINGVTIPTFKEKGGHPVIINEVVKKEIIDNYQNYETLKEVLANFPKKYIEVKSNSILKNINTPQELETYKYELAE